MLSKQHLTNGTRTNTQIQRINNGIISLINLSEITRFKNVELKTSFNEEFFKKIKNYINLD